MGEAFSFIYIRIEKEIIMWKYYLYVCLEGIGIFLWCRIINKLDKKYPGK